MGKEFFFDIEKLVLLVWALWIFAEIKMAVDLWLFEIFADHGKEFFFDLEKLVLLVWALWIFAEIKMALDLWLFEI